MECNKILLEMAESYRYDLDTFEFRGELLAKLSLENVAKVESMIRNDSDYLSAGDKTIAPRENDLASGSTAYWAHQLSLLLNDGAVSGWSDRQVIEGLVRSVDRENSTHLNADLVGINQTVERIYGLFSNGELLHLLKYPGDNYELVSVLSKPTVIVPDDKKHKERRNYSFATKFCHYACFYLFEGGVEQDNYSIYDFVVASAIPRYAEFYGIDFKSCDIQNYSEYIGLVDSIIAASGSHISRNGFDHLLWYYFKGRLKQLKKY